MLKTASGIFFFNLIRMKSELPRQRNLFFRYLPGLNEQIFGLVHLSDANRESKVKHKKCWLTRPTQMNANASTVKYTLHLSILHPNMAEEYPVFHCAFVFAFVLSQFIRVKCKRN